MADIGSSLRLLRPWVGLGLLALALFAAVLETRPSLLGPDALALDRILLMHSLLPRAATALLCGAALGLSGALLQRVLRNPIADPSTLGIAAGAQLALTLAMTFAPALVAVSREGVALAGGAAAAAGVLALSWKRGLDPVIVVLSGMVISMIAAALGAFVVLARGEYLMSLYIWGAGSLSLQSWDAPITIATRLSVGVVAAVLLLRPLAILGLDDAGARSLGVGLLATRLMVMLLAVWLAATVTAEVGIIGFVGLAAPAFARLAGARTPRQILLVAPIAGAVVLSITDSAVQLAGSGFADLAPTGAATALLGGPLLLWLLPRVRSTDRAPAGLVAPLSMLKPSSGNATPLLLLAAALIVLALLVGRGPDGWDIATGDLFSELLAFRGPRLVAAGAAGVMLAAAGTLMQRITANPMASPELLGVGAGSGVGLAAVLFLVGFPGPILMLGGMAAGALVALIVMLIVAARSSFGPERLLLAGIAVGAFSMAILSAVLAGGGMRAYALLVWLSGSTNRVGPFEATTALVAALVLAAPLFLFARWLDILPLGADVGRCVGLKVGRARLVLALFAAGLTAISSFIVGPLSLVGLLAPHLAARFPRGRTRLAAAMLIGATLLIGADWLSRIVAFPYQVPVGLFAALIGGPYLLRLLRHGDANHG
ncbi:Fe(3+)-hydroxamate ABC transporter permease FhuB [Starkeya sp. ORNL1]|uniref:Fe(3+)-hydroxamate ABC transporter permease FhuB n=1 Tax=Starkeya sp. ORNL1 TaxID=2709380 RepID=UPI001FEF7DC9|nr:Fe(3+)-hydroxamate ABC transporter permease FhuB [Starkeya sp. ORNL1]